MDVFAGGLFIQPSAMYEYADRGTNRHITLYMSPLSAVVVCSVCLKEGDVGATDGIEVTKAVRKFTDTSGWAATE